MNNKAIILTLFCFSLNLSFGQTVLNLENCVSKARKKSPSYTLAKTRVKTSYWAYRNFRAGILPQLSLSGQLPSYNGGIDRIIQPDGSYEFRNRSVAYEYLRFNVDQNIGLTGGMLSFSSDLQRIDNFEPTPGIEYVSVPLQFSYTQSVLLYNDVKWNKQIEPIRYEESQRRYIEDLEQIGEETVRLYFNALDAQVQYQIAALNNANQDTLFKISRGRYDLGKIAENELLQIELSYLNSSNELKRARLNLETASQDLKRFLGIPTTEELELIIPLNIPQFDVPYDEALHQAKANQQQVLEFRRRRLEADQAVARAKGNSGYQLSLNAGIGRSEQGETIAEVYPGSQQQQYVTLGFSVPIVDWGRNKASIRQAKASADLENVQIEQDEIAFEQEVYLQVMSFNMQKERLRIAAKADTIAQRRYEVTKNRYFIGKISITDLNIAQNEKDEARGSYLRELRAYWQSYYIIRGLTHWDFEDNRLIKYLEPEF